MANQLVLAVLAVAVAVLATAAADKTAVEAAADGGVGPRRVVDGVLSMLGVPTGDTEAADDAESTEDAEEAATEVASTKVDPGERGIHKKKYYKYALWHTFYWWAWAFAVVAIKFKVVLLVIWGHVSYFAVALIRMLLREVCLITKMASRSAGEGSGNTSKVYVNDPLHLKSFVNCYVEVKTNSGSSIRGFVYTIDPVSESVILLKRQDDKISMDIVVGHSVSSITHITSPEDTPSEPIPDEMLFVTAEQISDEEAERRRVQLKQWLCANHVPVVEDGNMLVMEDVIVIDSPYGLNQCFVSNSVIMERVHKLLKQMPWVDSE
ncbi:hypothetical protein ONE63_004764 [Megalurothrips usitatus]|uniref:AD domain-containing protein n=1 Tax=Megalurothrips usitatus TaxID=439358 RepID=A0AAV7X0Q3_9NEOP|nr:hypothetical protein ONE63_004764 [Megalurothrips usitatus]